MSDDLATAYAEVVAMNAETLASNPYEKVVADVAQRLYEAKMWQTGDNLRVHIVAAEPPIYATDGSAGFDLKATHAATVPVGGVCLVKTGIRVAMPSGFEMQIRPRSGLALKHGITVANAPGTIDSDYRGEIGVILLNFGPTAYRVSAGDRIAQGVICPVYRAHWEMVDELPDTARGDGGFGSSGR